MKKILILSSITLLSLGSWSCKKNASTPPPANSTSGVYGTMKIASGQYAVSGSLTPIPLSCTAFFANTPTTYITLAENVSSFVKVNAVSINNVPLKFGASSSSDYGDTTGTIVAPPSAWVVNGANGIPSFNYIDNSPIPGYTGYASLPDTIKKNQTTIITLNGVSGADEAMVMIYDQWQHTVMPVFTGYNISTTFSSSSLASLNAGTGSISVILTKNNVQTFNGKKFQFQSQNLFVKQITIK